MLFWSGLRTRLLIFVLLALLPMFGLILFSAARQRSKAAEDAQNNALLLTHLLASNHNQLISDARLLLQAMAQVQSVREQDTTTCDQLFAEMLTRYPNFSNIWVTDLEGYTKCTGKPVSDPNFTVRDVYWFQEVLETRDFVISDFEVGFVTRKPILTLAYPVYGTTRVLNGAIGLGLSLEWINTFLADNALPEETVITLIDQNGVVLARYPDPQNWVGKLYNNGEVLEAALAEGGSGTIRRVSAIDDLPRLYVFQSLAPIAPDVHVIVGISERVAYHDANETVRWNLLGLALVSLLVILIVWFGSEVIVRPVRHLVDVTQQITAGELSRRVEVKGVGELSQLAATFNEMASSVEQRVAQRTDELLVANENLKREIAERQQIERELQRYTARLQQSNAELENFAYIASHDLQEPLRKVLAFGSRLQSKYSEPLGAEGSDYIQRMQNAVKRMQDLINDLLSFSRVTSQAKAFEPVDLQQVVQSVITDLEANIEESSATVQFRNPLPTLDADPVQMRQLFQNLIGNALKYHRPGVNPEIKIYAEEIATGSGMLPHHQICVEDNGIGFEEKHTERIFALFERLHGRSEYEGTGMGLAICRKIVERHNGTITARSQPGAGSTFIVTLPPHQPPN